VDGTGSGSCPVMGFDISNAECSVFVIRELVTYLDTWFIPAVVEKDSFINLLSSNLIK
jgi:hypothetical protein